MKKLIVPVLLSTLAFAAPSMAAHPMCGKTELADAMGNLKDSMKAVKKAAKAGDVAKITSIANDMLSAIDKSYDLVPLTISDKADLDSAQQADFKKYQKSIEFLKGAVQELAAAKDMGAVKAALGKVSKASKKGHKAYKMDCDK